MDNIKENLEENIKEETNGSINYVVLGFVVLCNLTIAFAFITIMCVASYFLHEKNAFDRKFSTSRHRLVSYNPKTHERSNGVASIPQHLFKEDDFYSYEGNNGELFMVLKSGSRNTEYHCTGICYCEYEGEERRIALGQKIASRGVMTLIAAMTSSLAIFKAKEYFDEKCGRMLADECGGGSEYSSIKSKDTYCDTMDDLIIEQEEEVKPPEEKEDLSKKDKKEFLCGGRCMKLKGSQSSEISELINEAECEEKRLEGTVTVYGERNVYLDYENFAMDKFTGTDLFEFCEYKSWTKMPDGEFQSVCVGGEKVGTHFYNPSVICKQRKK